MNRLPHPKFQELADSYSAHLIAESRNVKKPVLVEGKKIICTGAAYKGQESLYVECYQIVPLEQYNGQLEPLPYMKHHKRQVEEGRERGYDAMLVEHQGQNFVLVGPEITYYPSDEGKQESLF